MLSKFELSLYKRHLNISSWGIKNQEKLKKAKIFVAGAGGLGSPLLFYLAAAGLGHFTIVDNDQISLSNLNRQILYKQSQIGQFKVDLASKIIKEFNPNVIITKIKDKITSINVEELIGDNDLIIDCLDNFTTRFLLNKVSVQRRIPLLHAGVADFNGQVTFLNPPLTPCLACFAPKKDSEDNLSVMGAVVGIIGSIQAMEVVKYFTGQGENLINKIFFFDGLDLKSRIVQVKKNPNCQVCG